MRKKTYIKRFGVIPAAKFTPVLTALYGLVIGVTATLAGRFAPVAGGLAHGIPGAIGTIGLGVGLVVLFTLAAALIGFIIGAILAALYNIVFSTTGGIEVELDIKERSRHQPLQIHRGIPPRRTRAAAVPANLSPKKGCILFCGTKGKRPGRPPLPPGGEQHLSR
ncbi:hypothetical protein FGU65_05185 [Methanoculleus sp. FWC-SCC1]|uniref:DUF3566 domain-containing protein n=1 Tax=Methanoculleus frigidifontis TaxID=2584085 RepID=A0ABT8M8N5_9EURY|nr:hypothetical protein [Methanoculleus sp. FWC-SCC1]MDN7024290.1 hypothetical protein [Methanoculleus sp. FWC-SCC1]